MSTAAVAARNIGGRTGGRVFPRGLSGGVGSDIDTVPRGLFGSNAAAGCCRAVGATIRAGNGRCQLGVLWRSVPRGYTLLDTVGRGPKRLSTERLELTHLCSKKRTANGCRLAWPREVAVEFNSHTVGAQYQQSAAKLVLAGSKLCKKTPHPTTRPTLPSRRERGRNGRGRLHAKRGS
jgi:hypothetical protein